MTARKLDIFQFGREPLYTMGVAAKLVGTTAQTLRVYEAHGLILPTRERRKRFYTVNDIRWMRCVRELIHVNKISIAALKKLLEYASCWEIKNCPGEQRADCTMPEDNHVPRMLSAESAATFSREISEPISMLLLPGNGRICASGKRVRCRFARPNTMSNDKSKP
jgi:MerR family transcriptional regulator/heat shock protein HspR